MSNLFKNFFGLSKQEPGIIPRRRERGSSVAESKADDAGRESSAAILGFDPANVRCSFSEVSHQSSVSKDEWESSLEQVVDMFSELCPVSDGSRAIVIVVFLDDADHEERAPLHDEGDRPSELPTHPTGTPQLPLEQCRSEFLRLLAQAVSSMQTRPPRAKVRYIPAICFIFCRLRSRLSELCGLWTDILSESFGGEDFIRAEDLYHSSVFVARACSVIVHFINHGSSALPIISASVDTGHLPRLPWVDMESVEVKPEEGSGWQGWSWGDAVRPLSAAPQEDQDTAQHHWCLFMLEIDAIEGSLSLIQYLHRLTRILAMHQSSAVPDPSTAEHELGEETGHTVQRGVLDSAAENMKHLTVLALSLQSGALFAVNCLMFSCRSEAYLKYKYLGSAVLNVMLVDIGADTIDDRLLRALQFQIGLLCLRQHEIAILGRDKEEEVAVDGSDGGLVLDSLTSFMSWIARNFLYDDRLGADTLLEVCASAPSTVPVPDYFRANSSPDGTMWPWGDEATPTSASPAECSTPPSPAANTSTTRTVPFWIPVRRFNLVESKGLPSDDPLLEWASILDSCLSSSPRSVSEVEGLPWFLESDAGRAWLMMFSILYNQYFVGYRHSNDRRPSPGHENIDRNFKMILGAVVSSLEQLMHLHAYGVDESIDVDPSNNAPLLQMHFILFLSRCVKIAPVAVACAARDVDLWDVLLCTDSFLLGGSTQVCSFLSSHVESSEKEPQLADASTGVIFPAKYVLARCSPNRLDVDDISLLGYFWLYLHDSIFAVFNNVIKRCLVGPAGYPRFEIIKFFEAFKIFGKLGADDLVFRGARWLAGLVDAGKGQRDAVSTVPEFLSVIISLNICGQQVILADSVVTSEASNTDSASGGNDNKKDLSAKLMAPVPKRPLLWHARSALIELILRVTVVSTHPKWLDVYLTSSHPGKTMDPPAPSASRDQYDESAVSAGTSLESSPPKMGVSPMQEHRQMGDPLNSSVGSPPRPFRRKSLPSAHPGARGSSQTLKIPSVNTLRYLMSDTRCLAAVSYIFSEICLKAANVASGDSKKMSSVESSSVSDIASQAGTVPGHLSDQNKSWLAAMGPAAALSSSAAAADDEPVNCFHGRLRSASSGDTHSISSMMSDSAIDVGGNSLSPLLTAASKVTVSLHQLIYEILRVMFDQVRMCGKVNSLIAASNDSTQILAQLFRIFRDPVISRRTFVQELWAKKNLWALQFGATLSYLKSMCVLHSGEGVDTSVDCKMRFFHLNLSLMVSIMADCALCQESFREFMISSAKLSPAVPRGALQAAAIGATRRPSMSEADSRRRKSGDEDPAMKSSCGPHAAHEATQRKPYRFVDFRTMFSAALQPLQFTGSRRAMETILVLMDMLFDGPVASSGRIIRDCVGDPDKYIGGLFPNNDDRPKVVNSLAVPILLTMLPLLHVNDQICVLNCFHSLVRGRASLYNLAVCSQMTPSMLDLVLDIFPGMPDTVQVTSIGLMQTLGQHSVSVSQLKRVFRMMQSRGDFRPPYTARLLSGLKGMIAEGEKPRHSFVFDGSSSGLQLPCINKWPAPRGYSFSIWLQVESPRRNVSKSVRNDRGGRAEGAPRKQLYKPHILSLRCKNGAGLDITLHGGVGKGKFKICFSSYGSGDECSSLTFPGLVVTEGKWHYFAVSHAAGGTFSSKGEISVLLDDQYFRMKDSFPFPRFSEPIEYPLIGDCPIKFQGGDETALRGQLSSIYFFSEALSEGKLFGIRGLGPSYVYSFEPHNIVHRDRSMAQSSKKQTVDPVRTVLDGSLTPLIMLSYNPAVWAGDHFLDNTPDKNIVKWGGSKTAILAETDIQQRPHSGAQTAEVDQFPVFPVAGKMHALKRPGTYRNTTQDAKMALDSLGGIKVLLPLFAQFDQPRLLPAGSTNSINNDCILDTQLSQVVLELLLILLDDSGHNSRLMTKINGFSLVAYLLERVSPQHLTVEVVNILWHMRERLFWSPALQDSLLEHLLTNFKLWVHAEFAVQQVVLDNLLALCAEAPSRVREALPIQRILDYLLLQYYYEEPTPEEISSYASAAGADGNTAMDGAAAVEALSNDGDSLDDDLMDDIIRLPGGKPQGDRTDDAPSMNTFNAFISRSRFLRYSEKVNNNRLFGQELVDIRGKLFKVLHTQIAYNDHGVFAEELHTLLGYVLTTTCGRSKAEALRLALRIMSVPAEDAESKVPCIFAAFSRRNCLQALLNLHKHKMAKVRLYTFLILCKLIYLSCHYPLPDGMRQKMSGTRGPTEDVEMGQQGPNMGNSPKGFDRSTMHTIPGEKSGRPQVPDRGGNTVSGVDDLYFLDVVGISVMSLGDLMVWIIDGLCDLIRVDIAQSTESDGRQVRLQCRTIAQAMQSTLLGDSCDYLVFDIDQLSCEPPTGDTAETQKGKFDSGSVVFTPQCESVHNRNGALERISSPVLSGGALHLGRINTNLLDPLGVKHAPDGTLLNTPMEPRKNALNDAADASATTCDDRIASPLRQKTETTRDYPEGLLSSSIVCAPMLFPAILSMVRFEGLQISLGLSMLVNLKTTILQNDHNADAILGTSSWQYWILQLIVTERNRHLKLERKCNQQTEELRHGTPECVRDKEVRRCMEKSAALIDTCMRMISDLQLIAVRLGRIACKPVLYNPLKSYPQRITGMDVLRDIGRGRRQLGAAVLRDTMSYFRMYGEQGELDAQQSGFDLLMQTLSSLQLEKTLLENKTTSSVFTIDDDYAMKVAALSKWLIGAIVFDFISVPITQGKALWTDDTPEIVSGLSTVRRRLHSTSFDCHSSDSSDHAIDSIGSVVMDGTTMDEVQGYRSRHGDIPSSSSSKDAVNSEMKHLLDGRVEQTWKLINGLLTMYGPLNNATWWSLVGMKLKAVGQLGLLTGLSALSQISDGIEQIMPTSAPSSANSMSAPVPSRGNVFHISGTPSKVANKLESPLVGTAYSVCWLLTRALESLYLIGGDVESRQSIALDALTKLRGLLTGLRAMGADFVESESRNIVSRISAGLGSCTLSIECDWVKKGLEYMCELLLTQRPFFLNLLLSEIEISVEKSASQDALAGDRQKVSLSGDDGDPSPAVVRIVSVCLMNGAMAKSSVVDVTLAVVKASLSLSPEHEVGVTWAVWVRALSSISNEVNRLEHELVMSRVNDIGLHKHTQEVRKELVELQGKATTVAKEILRTADSASSYLYQVQTDRLSVLLKHMDKSRRFNTAKWGRIVAELANERGPWGCATADQTTVFWMMDQATTIDYRRPRLKRNELGTNHRTASYITRGTYSNSEDSADISAAIVPAERVGGGLAQGLWRDLVKYQRKDLNSPERTEGDVVDQGDDGEDNEDAAASQGVVGDISAAVAGSATPSVAADEKPLFKEVCEIVTPAANSSAGGTVGILEVYKSRIVFLKTVDFDFQAVGQKLGNTDFLWACQNFPSSAWSCSQIVNVFQRSYQLRFVAIEIFFTNRRSIFINLHESATAELFLTIIRRRVRPPFIAPYFGRNPKMIINRFALPGAQNPISVTEAWQCREISNYEYLTFLNLIAGRTFNDLGQYPVFPWVLADYTSKKLDLRNPETFRDFKYSMGAQKEDQRMQFVEKYYDLKANYDADQEYAKKNNLQSVDSLPPFHYGSHYSCMGFVLWYLVRHEPYSSLSVWLQDGKFDKADRLFDSIEAAWRGCTTNQSDVKELIPEFFYNSDFLDNYNNIDLGTTQTGKRIGAVKLPRWAKNSQDFIHQHREALESDYVSMNLHHWIDLIFGYKQRPPHMGGNQAAVDAVNIYFHLTYAGAVDLDQLKESDPYLYSQTVRQIDNFGQTPTQLFDKPHVQRLPFDKCDIIWPMASVVRGVDTISKGQPPLQKPRKVICFKVHQLSDFPIIFIGEAGVLERLVTVDSSRIVGWHFWQVRQPDVVPPYQLKVDPQALRISQGLTAATPFSLFPGSYQAANRERRIGAPFAPPQLFNPHHLAESPPLFSGNKRFFCQEETDRLNVKTFSTSGGEHVGGRARASSSLSTASQHPSATGRADAKSKPGSAGKANPRPGGYDSRKYSTTGSGDAVMISPPKPRVDERLSSALFAYLPSANLLFSCGHWDHSFKVSVADTGRLVQSISHHRDVVTSLTLCSEYGSTWLITGSRDCTVMVWEVLEDKPLPLSVSPLYILYGHDDAVTCLAVSLELDIIASGSDDGSIIIHSLRGGNYIRSIFLSDSVPPPMGGGVEMDAEQNRKKTSTRSEILRRVTWIGVSREGYIVSYSSQDSMLCTFTLNGKFVMRREAGEHLHAFLLSEDGKVLLSGGDRSLLVMRWVHNLELANDGLRKGFEAVLDGSNAEDGQPQMSSPIRCLYLTKRERHLLVGLENGELRVMTQDSDYLRRRLHYKLMEIGILPQNHVTGTVGF